MSSTLESTISEFKTFLSTPEKMKTAFPSPLEEQLSSNLLGLKGTFRGMRMNLLQGNCTTPQQSDRVAQLASSVGLKLNEEGVYVPVLQAQPIQTPTKSSNDDDDGDDAPILTDPFKTAEVPEVQVQPTTLQATINAQPKTNASSNVTLTNEQFDMLMGKINSLESELKKDRQAKIKPTDLTKIMASAVTRLNVDEVEPTEDEVELKVYLRPVKDDWKTISIHLYSADLIEAFTDKIGGPLVVSSRVFSATAEKTQESVEKDQAKQTPKQQTPVGGQVLNATVVNQPEKLVESGSQGGNFRGRGGRYNNRRGRGY